MLNVIPNIKKSDQITRIAIGAILLLGAFLGFPRVLLVLYALTLIAEGVMSWSWIPIAMEKLGLDK